jgi:hypothetical protein
VVILHEHGVAVVESPDVLDGGVQLCGIRGVRARQILQVGFNLAQLVMDLFEQIDDLGQVGELLIGRAGDADRRQGPAGDQLAGLLADARDDPLPELVEGVVAAGGRGRQLERWRLSANGLAVNRRPIASTAPSSIVRRRSRVRLVMAGSLACWLAAVRRRAMK